MPPGVPPDRPPTMDRDLALSSHNLPFLESLYEQYQADPESIDPQWRSLIAGLDAGSAASVAAPAGAPSRTAAGQAEQIDLQHRVDRLISNYRLMGDYDADIDPLGRPREPAPALELSFYGLDERHLDRRFSAEDLFPGVGPVTLREILGRLRRTYCRKIGVEY